MLAGLNHNIRHRQKVYHIQTEDSGLNNPQIVTHIFVGGNILATQKISYEQHVGAPERNRVVREMMEQQHKSMLRNLVNGSYDDSPQECEDQTDPGLDLASYMESAPKAQSEPGSPQSLEDVVLTYLSKERSRKE